MAITEREIRRIQNVKGNSFSDGGLKTTMSNAPSRGNMAEGEQMFSLMSNKTLSLYKKLKGVLWKVNFSSDGNQYIDKNLYVDNDVVLDGHLQLRNTPIFEASCFTQQTNLTTDTEVQLLFATEMIDTTSSLSSSTFTAPLTGIYMFYYTLSFNQFDISSGPMSYIMCGLRKNADEYFCVSRIDDKEFTADTDAVVSRSASRIRRMSKGDTVKVFFYQEGGDAQVDFKTHVTAIDGNPRSSVFGGYLITK